MDYRIISGIFLTLVFLAVAWTDASADGFSWGALDVVRTSPAGDGSEALTSLINDAKASFAEPVSTGALDALLGAQSGGSSPLGALAAVASAKGGEYRPDALSYISRSHLGAGYYSSGIWESSSDLTSQRTGLWSGQMMMAPAWGKITSTFGFRPRFGRMHKGIDIAMTVGDTVCVPVGGVVARVSYEAGGYGNYVVVKHDNGLETRYAHLSASLVTPGDRVAPQQPIALSGNTGNSTGPHLHFETRFNGTAIDPQAVFDFSGGVMTPKRGNAYTRTATFSAGGVGALSQVSANGTRGKSLHDKRTYVVRAGDTLEKIAARAGMSVLELCKLNFISEGEDLKPGTMIRICR